MDNRSPQTATYGAVSALYVANPSVADTDLIEERPGYPGSDGDHIRIMPRAFLVAVAGNLSFDLADGSTLTFPAVAGVWYPLACCLTMLAATTTADQVLILW